MSHGRIAYKANFPNTKSKFCVAERSTTVSILSVIRTLIFSIEKFITEKQTKCDIVIIFAYTVARKSQPKSQYFFFLCWLISITQKDEVMSLCLFYLNKSLR